MKICQPVLERKKFKFVFVSLPWKPELWPDTFGGEDFLSLYYFFLRLPTRILHGSKKLKEFRRGHWEDASYEISSELAKWLGRRSRLKQNVNGRTTDNSPWHKVDWLSASGAKNILAFEIGKCLIMLPPGITGFYLPKHLLTSCRQNNNTDKMILANHIHRMYGVKWRTIKDFYTNEVGLQFSIFMCFLFINLICLQLKT